MKVGAGNLIVSLAFDVLPSFLPFGTSQLGPPDYKSNSNISSGQKKEKRNVL